MAACAVFPGGIFPAGLFVGFGEINNYTEPTTETARIKTPDGIEMNLIVGQSQTFPVQVKDVLDAIVEELVSPQIYIKINQGILLNPTLTIGVFDPIFDAFPVTVPDTISGHVLADYDYVELALIDGTSKGRLIINCVPDISSAIEDINFDTTGLATSDELVSIGLDVTAVKIVTDNLILENIQTAAEAAIAAFDAVTPLAKTADITALNNLSSANVQSAAAAAITAFDTATPLAKTSELSGLEVDLSTITGGGTATLASLEADIADIPGGTGTGGGGLVIGSGAYTFDASEKTITLTDTTITLEQIQEIRNLTKGKMLIYDSTESSSVIAVAAGVISWTVDFAYRGEAFADTDILQIVINSNAS